MISRLFLCGRSMAELNRKRRIRRSDAVSSGDGNDLQVITLGQSRRAKLGTAASCLWYFLSTCGNRSLQSFDPRRNGVREALSFFGLP